MRFLRLIVLVTAFTCCTARAQDDGQPTKVASPNLQAARWIGDRKIDRFEDGQRYLLLFWASWSEPCRRAMPAFASLSREAGDRLTFIAVNVWEHDEVAGAKFDERAGRFVKRFPGLLPMPVCADDAPGLKGTLAKSWLQELEISTLPACVLIDGEGAVVWKGHPSEARARLASEIPLQSKSMEDFVIEAESTVRRFLAASRGGEASAIAIAREALAGDLRDNPAALNAFAWEMLDNTRFEGKDPKLALVWASRAAAITNNADGMILDTLALAQFENGNIAEAVKTQEEAVRLFELAVPQDSEELTDMKTRLKRFREHADAIK